MELNVIRKDIESETRYSIYRDLELTFMGNLVKARSYRLVSANELIDSELTIESIVKISDKDSGIIQTKSAVNDIIDNYERRGISIYGMIADKISNTFKDDYLCYNIKEDLVKENERLTKELLDVKNTISKLLNKPYEEGTPNVEESLNIQYQNAIKEAKDLRSRLDRVTENWTKVSSRLDFTLKQHANVCEVYEDELAKDKSTISGLEGELSWHQASLVRHKIEIDKVNEVKDAYYKLINDRGVTIELLNKRVATLNSELDNCVTKLKSYEEQKVAVEMDSTIETLKEQVVELRAELYKSIERVKDARKCLLVANKDKWEFLQERNKLRGELEHYKSMGSKEVVEPNYTTNFTKDFIAYVEEQFNKYSDALDISDKLALMGASDVNTEFQNWYFRQNG